MRPDEEINFLIERILYRLNGEALQKPINKPIRDAYLKAIEILKNRVTDPFKAGLSYNDINQHSLTQSAINQATGYVTGDISGKLVLFNIYCDGTIENQDDIPEETYIPQPPVIINTMTFNQNFFEFKNPVYALRYCSADGSSPFMQGCPWDLTAKSVTADDAGIFAVPMDMKKLIRPDGTIYESYIDGVIGNYIPSKENTILILLESDPIFLIESNSCNPLGEAEDSKEFQDAVNVNAFFREKAYREYGAIYPDILPEEIAKSRAQAHREISFSQANIIAIGRYGETEKLIQAGIVRNKLLGRLPLAGFNYIPELGTWNSWLQNKVEAQKS